MSLLSNTHRPSPSLFLQDILWSKVEVWKWGRNVLALRGTQSIQAKNWNGEPGRMEDVGYRVRRCAYHWHHRQSAKPLRRLQPSFDGKKRQILCPSAKGSFHDSTILRRSNSRGWNLHLSSPPPFSVASSLAAIILSYSISQHFFESLGRIILVGFGSRKW